MTKRPEQLSVQQFVELTNMVAEEAENIGKTLYIKDFIKKQQQKNSEGINLRYFFAISYYFNGCFLVSDPA